MNVLGPFAASLVPSFPTPPPPPHPSSHNSVLVAAYTRLRPSLLFVCMRVFSSRCPPLLLVLFVFTFPTRAEVVQGEGEGEGGQPGPLQRGHVHPLPGRGAQGETEDSAKEEKGGVARCPPHAGCRVCVNFRGSWSSFFSVPQSSFLLHVVRACVAVLNPHRLCFVFGVRAFPRSAFLSQDVGIMMAE